MMCTTPVPPHIHKAMAHMLTRTLPGEVQIICRRLQGSLNASKSCRDRPASTGFLPALRAQLQKCLQGFACPRGVRIANANVPSCLLNTAKDPI